LIGVLFLIFSIFDGVVRLNTAPSAAPVRAAMITALALAVLIWMMYHSVRFPLPGAVLVGVLAAYTISEAYWRPGGYGIQGWLIVAGIYAAQTVARREWIHDLAIAGVGLAVLVILAVASGVPVPDGLWNRNMVAGLLAALLPAAWTRWRPGGAIVALAIVVTGSRGALVAASVAGLALAWPRLTARHWLAPVGLAAGVSAAPVLALGMYGLIDIRSATVWRRLECMAQVLALWWSRSPWFGLGQFQTTLITGELANNAHSVPLTLAAVTGLVGLLIVLWSMIGLGRGRIRGGWELASLLAICTHALIEENVAWWPVAIVAGIVAADVFEVGRD